MYERMLVSGEATALQIFPQCQDITYFRPKNSLMWHVIMQQAAETGKVLQGEVSLSGRWHDSISAKCGGAWNESLTRNNYCT